MGHDGHATHMYVYCPRWTDVVTNMIFTQSPDNFIDIGLCFQSFFLDVFQDGDDFLNYEAGAISKFTQLLPSVN